VAFITFVGLFLNVGSELQQRENCGRFHQFHSELRQGIFTGKMLTGRKSAFRRQGRLVAPIHVKFGRTKGHMGPLGQTKFHANRFTGVGTRPKNGKNFHFLVKSRLAGANPLTDFYSC